MNAAGDEPTALLDLIIDADSRAYFKGLWTFAINNTLNDLDKATDVDLLDLQCVQASDLLGVSFMQFNSTVANTISVTVTLPTFDTALNQLELDAKLRAAIPVNFNFGTSETELQFDLTAQTDTTAGAEGVGVSVGAFAFTQNDAAFEFGRPSVGAVDDVTGLSSLTEIPLGMLTGTLSDVETGQFGLYSDFQNAMGDAFAATVCYAQGTGITTVELHGPRLCEFRVEEVDDVTNTAIVIDFDETDPFQIAQLDLVKYSFAATLPTVFDTVGPNSILGVDVDLIHVTEGAKLGYILPDTGQARLMADLPEQYVDAFRQTPPTASLWSVAPRDPNAEVSDLQLQFSQALDSETGVRTYKLRVELTTPPAQIVGTALWVQLNFGPRPVYAHVQRWANKMAQNYREIRLTQSR